MPSVKNISEKLSRKAKYLGRDIGHAFGVHDSFFRNARGSRIVIYHGICKRDHTLFNPIFLTEQLFEQHLQLYKTYCNVVSLDDYYKGNFSSEKFNICLTFDDGFANNYKYVLPLLEKYQLPVTFFITAISSTGYDILWNDFLGIISKYGPKQLWYKFEHYYKGEHDKYISVATGKTLNERLRASGFDEKAEMMEALQSLLPLERTDLHDYWLQLDAAQISRLSQSPLVTIGAHSCYHNDLAQIDTDAVRHELSASKTFLENLIRKPVNSFAFPYGTYTRQVIDMAKASGYDKLLAMDFLFDEDHTDPAMRERFTVNPFISPKNQLYATISRRYE